MISSSGNDEIVQKNVSLLGSNILSECKIVSLDFTRVKEGEDAGKIMCRQVMYVKPTGAPSLLIGMIKGMHAKQLQQFLDHIRKTKENLEKIFEESVKEQVAKMIAQDEESNYGCGSERSHDAVHEVRSTMTRKQAKMNAHSDPEAVILEPTASLRTELELSNKEKIAKIEQSAKDAILKTKRPVKLTWENLKYTVNIKKRVPGHRFKTESQSLEVL